LDSGRRYSRQELFAGLGKKGQKKLLGASVVVAGCGGLGCLSSSLLVRAGVGRLRVVDRDYVELENLQRQTLFTEEHAGQRIPKAVAAAEVLKAANSDVTVEAEVSDISPRTAEKLLGGFDLVIDALDNIETRFVVNDFCLKNAIPWIYGAAVGSTGMVMNISPEGKPCLRCIMPELPSPGAFGTCDTLGVISPAPIAAAAVQAAEAVKTLTGSPGISRKLLILDLWQRGFEEVEVRANPRCPTCAIRRFDALESPGAARALRLCGRDSVEVVPEKETALDLEKLEQALSQVGKVQYNGYSLWLDAGDLEIVIFPDGRAIVKGTDDIARARSAYSKFVGS
jgi:adenylyltransferase/sulfurtransferase